MGISFGFSPAGFNQILVFNDREDFQKIMAANPHMTAIVGDSDRTQFIPGVFIAGVRGFQSGLNTAEIAKTFADFNRRLKEGVTP